MRTMVKTLVRSNTAGRMIVVSGALGFVLMVADGVLHAMPELASLDRLLGSALLQERLIFLGSMALFAAAYLAARAERGGSPNFLKVVMSFWEFRPVKEPLRSYRLLEWAHYALILFLFHRAIFNPI